MRLPVESSAHAASHSPALLNRVAKHTHTHTTFIVVVWRRWSSVVGDGGDVLCVSACFHVHYFSPLCHPFLLCSRTREYVCLCVYEHQPSIAVRLYKYFISPTQHTTHSEHHTHAHSHTLAPVELSAQGPAFFVLRLSASAPAPARCSFFCQPRALRRLLQRQARSRSRARARLRRRRCVCFLRPGRRPPPSAGFCGSGFGFTAKPLVAASPDTVTQAAGLCRGRGIRARARATELVTTSAFCMYVCVCVRPLAVSQSVYFIDEW